MDNDLLQADARNGSSDADRVRDSLLDPARIGPVRRPGSGKVFEAVSALVQRRRPRDLYHSALAVIVPEGRFVIEMAPIPDPHGERRGVVAEGPVGAKWAGRFRLFRYEIRRWPAGVIPDQGEATSTVTVDVDPASAQRLLDLVPSVPTPVWGRDELRAGEMWNSNSVTSWLLTHSGVERRADRATTAAVVRPAGALGASSPHASWCAPSRTPDNAAVGPCTTTDGHQFQPRPGTSTADQRLPRQRSRRADGIKTAAATAPRAARAQHGASPRRPTTIGNGRDGIDDVPVSDGPADAPCRRPTSRSRSCSDHTTPTFPERAITTPSVRFFGAVTGPRGATSTADATRRTRRSAWRRGRCRSGPDPRTRSKSNPSSDVSRITERRRGRSVAPMVTLSAGVGGNAGHSLASGTRIGVPTYATRGAPCGLCGAVRLVVLVLHDGRDAATRRHLDPVRDRPCPDRLGVTPSRTRPN